MKKNIKQIEKKRLRNNDASITDSDLIPLCVDLDGTLLKTDTLVESFLLLVKSQPLKIFKYLYWILKGKSYFKQNIADRIDLEIETLPYNKKFVDYLTDERRKGRPLILATASIQKIAFQTEAHFKLFDDVLASDTSHNLKGQSKLNALIKRFGDFGFDYAGNSRQDLTIWINARNAIIVNPSMGVKNGVKKLSNVAHIFDERPKKFKAVFNGIRARQWPKNILLFVPLIVSQKFLDTRLLFDSVIAFCCFCLCASSLYIINDLFDLTADRKHPTKCLRPFAAGDLSIISGVVIAIFLLSVAIIGTFFLPSSFLYFLGFYGICSFFYSITLKNLVIIDVLILSSLYTLRILAGGIATSIPISFWLLSFSMFIFFSLAILKRYAELLPMSDNGKIQKIAGRGYWTNDIETLRILGISSGYLSVLVMALYINSDQVTVLYKHPSVLWMLCPLFLFWISRIWLLAGRGQVDDDPVLFAIQDVVSLVVGILTLIVVLSAA